jgi:hypothetical protein
VAISITPFIAIVCSFRALRRAGHVYFQAAIVFCASALFKNDSHGKEMCYKGMTDFTLDWKS